MKKEETAAVPPVAEEKQEEVAEAASPAPAPAPAKEEKEEAPKVEEAPKPAEAPVQEVGVLCMDSPLLPPAPGSVNPLVLMWCK